MARTEPLPDRTLSDRSRSLRLILPAILLAALATSPTPASEEEEHIEVWRRDHATPHHVEIFVGDTVVKGNHGFTLGAEYEYHFAHHWGTGFLFDDVVEGLNSTEVARAAVLAVPLYWHPAGEWRFVFAPGVELLDLTSEEAAHDEEDVFFLFRIGVAYEFPITKFFSIAPAFDIDLIDERERGWQDAYVFGLNFGFKPGRRD